MVQKELGNKCLVDTFRVYDNTRKVCKGCGYQSKHEIDKKDISIFIEMDGFSWDSSEYDTLEEFLQSIINHAYNVTMGKE